METAPKQKLRYIGFFSGRINKETYAAGCLLLLLFVVTTIAEFPMLFNYFNFRQYPFYRMLAIFLGIFLFMLLYVSLYFRRLNDCDSSLTWKDGLINPMYNAYKPGDQSTNSYGPPPKPGVNWWALLGCVKD